MFGGFSYILSCLFHNFRVKFFPSVVARQYPHYELRTNELYFPMEILLRSGGWESLPQSHPEWRQGRPEWLWDPPNRATLHPLSLTFTRGTCSVSLIGYLHLGYTATTWCLPIARDSNKQISAGWTSEHPEMSKKPDPNHRRRFTEVGPHCVLGQKTE